MDMGEDASGIEVMVPFRKVQLEKFPQLVCAAAARSRRLVSCQPPAGRAYAYVAVRATGRRNAINCLHSLLSASIHTLCG